ncbi:MAG: hypothetical protein ACJA2Q_002273 [Pseudohongiellaceae bacterium]|jgi:hypothetical protein
MASCVHGVGGCLSLRRIQPRPYDTQSFAQSKLRIGIFEKALCLVEENLKRLL